MIDVASFVNQYLSRKLKGTLHFYQRKGNSKIVVFQPLEIAYCINLNALEVVRYFEALFCRKGKEAVIKDVYIDTVNFDLFHSESSLRIRTFPELQTSQADIIWLGWKFDVAANIEKARTDSVIVQSLLFDNHGRLEDVYREYHLAGYKKILEIYKKRTTFEIQPAVFDENDESEIMIDFEEQDIFSLSSCYSHGFRVIIDEFFDLGVKWPTIVEIEFDESLDENASQIVSNLISKYNEKLKLKIKNKIDYYLSGFGQSETGNTLVPANSNDAFKSSTLFHTGMPWSSNSSNHILPGQGLFVSENRIRKRFPKYSQVRVKAPGRLHFGVFNSEKLKNGQPGGGGIGISTSLVNCIITVRINSVEVESVLTPTTEHYIKLFCRYVEFDYRQINVEINQEISSKHRGLGSNVSRNTALLKALNILFDSPFSDSELCIIAMENYVEDSRKIFVEKGMDSGLGSACLLNGGLTWVDENGEYKGNLPLNDYTAVVLDFSIVFNSDFKGPKSMDKEKLKSIYDNYLVDFIKDDYWPAFVEGNLNRFFQLSWKYNELWSDHFFSYVHGEEFCSKFQNAVKEVGGTYCGMSSEGPLIFVILDEQSKFIKLKEIIEQRFGKDGCSFALAPIGNTIEIEELIPS